MSKLPTDETWMRRAASWTARNASVAPLTLAECLTKFKLLAINLVDGKVIKEIETNRRSLSSAPASPSPARCASFISPASHARSVSRFSR